jgi:hypothetical protein
LTRFCSFPGCDNKPSPKASGGLCNSHYWQKHKGRPLTLLAYRRNVILPWIEAHVEHRGDDCLILPFKRKSNGYGQVKFNGKNISAHRHMCKLAHGAPPTETHEAAHSCGNGHLGCVNPRHLRWATSAENKADMVAHGTRRQGEAIPWAKMTEGSVRAIRELRHTCSEATVSRLFGITPAHVNKIVRHAIWRHVTP